MAVDTSIGWTRSTFNAVIGCAKVGPGCENCFAWVNNVRFHKETNWGAGAPRKLQSDDYWRQPLNWNRKAAKTGEFWPVFCASHADVFDNEWPEGVRDRLWKLIEATPHLTWQLVTKRIGNVMKMIPDPGWFARNQHVWLIATIVNQEEADRDLPKLLEVPGCRVWGVSYEPALGPVDWAPWLRHNPPYETDGIAGGLRPSVSAERRDRSAPGRVHMEDREAAGKSLEQHDHDDALPAAPDRHVGAAGLPRGQGDALPQAGCLPSAPPSVAALQRPHPGRLDDQPQERTPLGQPTRESGVGDLLGANTALDARPRNGAVLEAERRIEPDGEIDRARRRGDSAAARGRREVSSDSRSIRRDDPGSVEDRSRREVGLDWIIGGFESRQFGKCRDGHIEWLYDLIDQCDASDCVAFIKQLGHQPMLGGQPYPATGKGTDPAEWPEQLRVQAFPFGLRMATV